MFFDYWRCLIQISNIAMLSNLRFFPANGSSNAAQCLYCRKIIHAHAFEFFDGPMRAFHFIRKVAGRKTRRNRTLNGIANPVELSCSTRCRLYALRKYERQQIIPISLSFYLLKKTLFLFQSPVGMELLLQHLHRPSTWKEFLGKHHYISLTK